MPAGPPPDAGTQRLRAPVIAVLVGALIGAALGLVAGLLARAAVPPIATTTFEARDAPSARALDDAASMLQARLRIFDDPDATVTAQPGALVAVEHRTPGSLRPPAGWDALADPARFELRPVLRMTAAGDPGWSTTPVTACQYSTGRDACTDGINSDCAYGDDAGACDPDALAGREVVLLGTDSAIYRLGPAILTNADIERATTFVNGPAASVIQISLTPDGSERLREATGDNIGRQLAIVLDQAVISAPSVVQPIASGRLQVFQLPMSNEDLEAQVVALGAGPLPAFLRRGKTTIEERREPLLARILALTALGAVLGGAVGFLIGRRRRRVSGAVAGTTGT